mgnify:CR=1 FL=1
MRAWTPDPAKQWDAILDELKRVEKEAKREAYADILEMLHRTPYISVLARGLRYKLSALEEDIENVK